MEAFPEGRSYVRRLASKHPFVCPVLGGDLGAIIREGQFALAQTHYRQGAFQEAADLFNKLLQETAPTAALLRGLGLSLARLQRFDQAYKHLRAALEQEQPKDPFTAAYLALCGAMGRPTQPEDKPKNVAWAVRLLSKYAQTGNAEWAGVLSTVHAEARNCCRRCPSKSKHSSATYLRQWRPSMCQRPRPIASWPPLTPTR